MNESENYLDQLLNAVDGRSDLNDSDPVNPEEIESKEQMPQKSTRETIDIPNSNDLFMDQFEQELRKDNDPDEFLKQFEQELDRDESSQGVTKATQPMLDDIDQIMESVNQEAANDTAEMETSAVEKTAEQKEDTAEVKNDEGASEDGIDDLAIDDIGIDDFGLDDPETENEKAVSDEDDELMKILSGTGEDSEIPEADNAKAEVQPDDGGKEEKKPKKQGFLAKLSKLLFGDDEPDEEEISGMQAEPAVTEMSMDDMDILKELEGSSDDDKKPPAEPYNTPPLPKVPVILVFVMAASILVLVLAGTHLLGYSNSFADADQAFAEGRYSDAFQAVAGEKVKEKDTDTYEKYRITAMVSAEYEAYESMMDAEVYDMALDSLIRTVQRYDKYLQDAETYGCRGEFDKIESAAETALQQDFGLTAEDARTMYALSNKETYSREIYKVLEKAGLSEVTE